MQEHAQMKILMDVQMVNLANIQQLVILPMFAELYLLMKIRVKDSQPLITVKHQNCASPHLLNLGCANGLGCAWTALLMQTVQVISLPVAKTLKFADSQPHAQAVLSADNACLMTK